MKRITIIASALLTIATTAHAAPFNTACHGDSMRPEGDKIAHLEYSVVIGAASNVVTDDPWVAFGVSLLPGLYRELWRGDCFSFQDMTYNTIGSAIGAYAGFKIKGLIITPRKVTYSIDTNIF